MAKETQTPEPVCKIEWRHEGKTGVWVYVEPRPSQDAQLDFCMRIARALERAENWEQLETTAETIRADLGFDRVFVHGQENPLDLRATIGLR